MDVGNPEVRHSAGFENRLPAPPNLNGGTLYSKPYLPLRARVSEWLEFPFPFAKAQVF